MDRLRSSLFFLPALSIVIAYLASRWLTDLSLGTWAGKATVDSARAVLSTVAAATITFASIAFSISLLIMQQGSSQHTPRVLPVLTRDPFNRRVIALVMATFTFSLVTLQQVRGPLSEGGEEAIPQLAVAVSVLLGVGAVLAVVGAINHTAQMMQISAILDRVVAESRRSVPWSADGDIRAQHRSVPSDPDPVAGVDVTFETGKDGWVRGVDVSGILQALPPGATFVLATVPGRYAVGGSLLGVVHGVPGIGADDEERIASCARAAVRLGPTRSVDQDPLFAIRQLVDVALRALSPGINDPTTAFDAIVHLGSVLVDRLCGDPVPNWFQDDRGAAVSVPHAPTDEDVADHALDELRVAAVEQPQVVIYLLEMVSMVADVARRAGVAERADPLRDQARLLCDTAVQVIDGRDRERVLEAYRTRIAG